MCFRIFSFFLMILINLPLNGQQSSDLNLTNGAKTSFSAQKQMIHDIDFIVNLFEFKYAPFEWKRQRFDWDLENENKKLRTLPIDDPSLTIKEFQKGIKKFCKSLNDYHVVSEFYSTESAYLPFQIQCANGKFFVSYIDEESFKDKHKDVLLAVGDQLLLFNGKPIEEAVAEFEYEEIGRQHNQTDLALASFYFTHRLGTLGHEIPRGTAEIVFLKPFFNERHCVVMDWDYYPETIVENDKNSVKKLMLASKQISNQHPLKKQLLLSQKKFLSPHYNLMRRNVSVNESMPNIMGSRKSAIPELGPVLWQAEANGEFYAYLFMLDCGNVGGYIRIPSYIYSESDEVAAEFAEIIELFEEMSDILVIDQLNNGGGVVLYMYALLSMLADKPLDVPSQQLMITQEDVYLAQEHISLLETIKNDRMAKKVLGKTLEGFPISHNFVKQMLKYQQFIIEQWNLGYIFTENCYLYGIDQIHPHPEVNYRKPILVLVNALDFSAADFFPAILQDSKRAIIMGTKTAGAGGYVESVSFPNLNGIDRIDFTASFSLRPGGLPLENLGVMPDIIYEVTQIDLQNSYIDYKRNVLRELKSMILDSALEKTHLR